MNSNAQAGLLLILAAVALAVLWTRGSLADAMARVTNALGGNPTGKTGPLLQGLTSGKTGAGAAPPGTTRRPI